jgi:hypothetical protein
VPQSSVTSPSGSLRGALRRLDPTTRALLDLSFRHRWTPDEIAKVLSVDPETVLELRDAALVRVAADIGLTGDDELGRARELLAGRPANGAATPTAARPRSRRRIGAAAVGLAALAAAIVVPLTAGGSAPTQAAEPAALLLPTPPPAPPPAEPLLRFGKLPGAPTAAYATARLVRGTGHVELSIGGLPRRGPRSFVVWLIDPPSRHRTLARFGGGYARVEITLPRDFRRYRWLGVVRVRRRYPPPHKRVLELYVPRIAGLS